MEKENSGVTIMLVIRVKYYHYFEEEYENVAETINNTMQNNVFYEQVQKWADEYGIKVTVNDEVLDKIN